MRALVLQFMLSNALRAKWDFPNGRCKATDMVTQTLLRRLHLRFRTALLPLISNGLRGAPTTTTTHTDTLSRPLIYGHRPRNPELRKDERHAHAFAQASMLVVATNCLK